MTFYVHITTACQMACSHCCFDYGNGKRGTHMAYKRWAQTLALIKRFGDDFITLGGGEPTMHPAWCRMIHEAAELGNVLVVTNGYRPKLLEMALGEMLPETVDVALSHDSGRFHNTSPEAYRYVERIRSRESAMKARRYDYNYAKRGRFSISLRDVSHGKLLPYGRAVGLVGDDEPATSTECRCSAITVYQDGRVALCGCPDAPVIGQVGLDGYTLDEAYVDEVTSSDYYNEHSCDSPRIKAIRVKGEAV